LIFLQVPTSQSVFFNFPIIIASLLGSLVIVLTRRMVLRHIRFRTFYSTMQTAFASLKILMVVLILFLVINAIASSIGIILPQSLVNRIVLMIFSAVTCAISFVYYTFVDSQQQSQALSSACFGIASRERDASTKLWWVLKGSNEMSKYFSLLGFPIKEDSLKRILLNRLFQDRNNDRFLSSLSRKLTRGRPPVVILNQLNSSKGADLIDVGKQSLTKVAMLGFNEYAPALSLLVSLLGLIVAWVRHWFQANRVHAGRSCRWYSDLAYGLNGNLLRLVNCKLQVMNLDALMQKDQCGTSRSGSKIQFWSFVSQLNFPRYP